MRLQPASIPLGSLHRSSDRLAEFVEQNWKMEGRRKEGESGKERGKEGASGVPPRQINGYAHMDERRQKVAIQTEGNKFPTETMVLKTSILSLSLNSPKWGISCFIFSIFEIKISDKKNIFRRRRGKLPSAPPLPRSD